MKRPLSRSLASLLVLLSLGSPALAQVKSGSAASASGDAASASQTGAGVSGGAAPAAISLQPLSLTGALQAGGAPALAPRAAPAAAAPAAAAAAPAAIPAGVITSDPDETVRLPRARAAAPNPDETVRLPRAGIVAPNLDDTVRLPRIDTRAPGYVGHDGAFFDRAARRGDFDAIHFPDGPPGGYASHGSGLSRPASTPAPVRAAPSSPISIVEKMIAESRSPAERLAVWVKSLFRTKDAEAKPPEFDRRAAEQAQLERLPARALQLTHLSRLTPADAVGLIEWVKTADIPVDAPLPYPPDTTFSLELELEVRRQLTDDDMRKLFPDNALTRTQWEMWRLERELPIDAWMKVHRLVMTRLRMAIPAGWKITDGFTDDPGLRNFIELKTNNGRKDYHENTPEDWKQLIDGLESLQRVLPGGFYSGHIHTGRESLIVDGYLPIDNRRFVELYFGFESFWRGLMGLPYELLPDGAPLPSLIGLAKEPHTSHHHWLNKSDTFPTVENKNVGALMTVDETGAKRLDPSRLRADLSGNFAFFDTITRAEPLPLASMGLPAVSGVKPGRKQLFHFLDLVYGGDLTGKALALKRLSALPARTESLPDRTAELRRVFAQLGLAQVYRLHAAHDGWDENLTLHLLERNGRLLHILARDLLNAGIGGKRAAALMPPEIRPALAQALEEELRLEELEPERLLPRPRARSLGL